MRYAIDVVIIACVLTLVNIIRESCKENRRISFSNYQIKDRRIKKAAKAVLVADLHNSRYSEGNGALLKSIELINPDFVLVAGDMIVGKEGVPIDVGADFLCALGERYPVYVGKGNHELRISLYEKYGDMWEQLYNRTKDSVTWLINESIHLPEYNMTIYGLDMKAEYYRRFRKLYMDESYLKGELPEINKNSYNILIGHNPDYFEEYAGWGADLTVSGHVHGGLMIIPYLGGLVSPMVKLFPKYYKGLYDKDGRKLIVSAGLGLHTLKIRVNNEPDLVTINFVR